ncbi:AAA family ATPase [Candidatus Bathyarchaeota archaeon]|nr:AAA family ATPase [Candidatus Bathyarchaeota archaeon]NIU81709.1 AAA family ATPase [Candidatus Bathyarchaeota archaeon]NIV68357.1 AAA family ATPase [Candidatus Bathyarchaeota archaeon]NIW16436.1 AAA family ATPase [Candidatus Bathyarchaeota archaeon]NIW34299.1 AAA family ATPase [Candidatus Bathyarchaeota archaeon]
MRRRVSTGCSSLDRLLGGGLPSDVVSLVYGEAETGKSSLAIQCSVNCARAGFKSIFIDSDGTFSSTRLSQIAYRDQERISPRIILIKPNTFQEQIHTIDHLERYITRSVGLLVVDTITSLYRATLGEPKRTFALNRELNRQMAYLAEIATNHELSTLITGQVRSVLFTDQHNVEPVARRVLKFWSDIVVNLKLTGQPQVVRVKLEKHPTRKTHESCYLSIERTGIRDYDQTSCNQDLSE